MAIINEDEIAAAGLNPRVVKDIARRLENAARKAHKHRISIFVGSGSAQLRFDDLQVNAGDLILAQISEGSWDDGDGQAVEGIDGLLRGEY